MSKLGVCVHQGRTIRCLRKPPLVCIKSTSFVRRLKGVCECAARQSSHGCVVGFLFLHMTCACRILTDSSIYMMHPFVGGVAMYVTCKRGWQYAVCTMPFSPVQSAVWPLCLVLVR